MEKETERTSYGISQADADRLPEQGLTASYFNNTLELIKRLGITSVRDVAHDQSDMPSTHFLGTLIDTKEWLEYKALNYSKKNRAFGDDLEKLLKADPLTKDAVRFQWCGLYQSKDPEPEEHAQYSAFSVFWAAEKTNKFKELVEKYWQEKKSLTRIPEPAKSSFIKKTLYYLGRRAVDTAVIAMLLAPPVYLVSKYVVIPQAATYLIETVRPEIRNELEFHYQTYGNINIKEVSEGLLNEFPKLKMFQSHLESVVKEEADKLEQKKQQEKEPPQPKKDNTEEEF